jgi:hypothetical protein
MFLSYDTRKSGVINQRDWAKDVVLRARSSRLQLFYLAEARAVVEKWSRTSWLKE